MQKQGGGETKKLKNKRHKRHGLGQRAIAWYSAEAKEDEGRSSTSPKACQ